jgi:uncharacterized membrane protein
MDQISYYLAIALNVAFLVCFLMLMWQLLIHKQWLMVLLSLFFAVVCGGAMAGAGALSIGPGYLIAMVIGWQEAKNWKIQKLMRIYSALFVVCFILFANTVIESFTNPPPKVDPRVAKQQAAREAAQKAAQKGIQPR